MKHSEYYHLLNHDSRYPYNNFLHHHVENTIVSCLESKKALLIDHLLQHCDLGGKILEAERNFTLSTNSKKVLWSYLFIYLFFCFYFWIFLICTPAPYPSAFMPKYIKKHRFFLKNEVSNTIRLGHIAYDEVYDYYSLCCFLTCPWL